MSGSQPDAPSFALTRTTLERERRIAVLKTLGAALGGYVFFIPFAIGWYFEYSGPPLPEGMVLIPSLGTGAAVVLRFRSALRGTRARFLIWVAWALIALGGLGWAGFIRMAVSASI